jgi:hypothetical protein
LRHYEKKFGKNDPKMRFLDQSRSPKAQGRKVASKATRKMAA